MCLRFIILYTAITVFSACAGADNQNSAATNLTVKMQTQTSSDAVGWRLSQMPLKTADLRFRINLPPFPDDADWIAGVKPAQEDEAEKISIGVISWENRDEENSLKRLSKIEDYPMTQSLLTEGRATLNAPVGSNQTLVIYMEISPSTQTIFNTREGEISSNFSNGSYVVFNGKVEATGNSQTDSLIALVTTAGAKIRERDLAKNGSLIGGK